MPVPADAPPPPAEHFKLGKPSAQWTYTNAVGAVLGYVLRFDTPDGGKRISSFDPLASDASGALDWRWESWPPKRPLYGLQRLAERPSAPVVVCEGEKAADAATRLLPGFIVVASPNGAKSAAKADWTPLRGRDVIIWPDADAAGLEYAQTVVKCLGAAGVRKQWKIVSPPGGVAAGWDAADALAEGWTTTQAAALISEAKPFKLRKSSRGDANDATHPEGGGRRRTPQRDTLIGLTEGCELWHDAERIAYATYPVNSHHEHWPIRSREFRMWLSGQFYTQTGSVIGGQALEDGIRILEAQAVNDGPQYRAIHPRRARLQKTHSRFMRCALARGRDDRRRLVCGRRTQCKDAAHVLDAPAKPAA